MVQQQIPQEAYQLGETYHLGTPTAVYRTQYTQADILFFWLQLILSLLTIGTAIGLIVATEVFHIRLTNVSLLVLIVLGALPLASTLRSTRRRMPPPYVPFTKNLRVYVYEHGLIRLRTVKPEIIRWNDIKRVRCYTYQDAQDARGFQPFVTVRRSDGKSFRFGANIGNVTLLGKTIKQEYTKRKQV